MGQFQRSQRERSHNTLLRYNRDSHYDHALCRYALFCVTTHYNRALAATTCGYTLTAPSTTTVLLQLRSLCVTTALVATTCRYALFASQLRPSLQPRSLVATTRRHPSHYNCDSCGYTRVTTAPSPPRSCVATATARCYTVLPLRPRSRGYTLTLTTVPWLTACLPPHPLVLRLHPCCGHALVATYTLALPMITLFDLFVSPGFYPNRNERKPTYGILSSFFFSSLPSFFHFFQSNTSAQHCVIVRGVVARRAEL